MLVCFHCTFSESAGAVATVPLNISCLSNFYEPGNDSKVSIHFTNQNTMSLASHVKALAPGVLLSFFYNFAQLVSHFSHRLNGEEKHIPF